MQLSQGPASRTLTDHNRGTAFEAGAGSVGERPASKNATLGPRVAALLKWNPSLCTQPAPQPPVVVPQKGVPPMKSVLAIVVVAGLASACTYRHETVERPAPAATVVATPVPASNTVVYTDPAPATATTTVYTR